MSSHYPDDDALEIRPHHALNNPEHLYSPLTWGPKARSESVITANKIVKTFTTDSVTGLRFVLELTMDKDCYLGPVHANEFTIVTGPSGAGKSTLIRILGGMLRPDRGELKLKLGNDKLYPINSFQPKLLIEMRVKFIGYVLQPPILLQDQTALQNVEFPMILAGHRRNVRLNEATQLLSAVGLADRIHMPAGQLSKSEQQRVAIAQAFANNPPIVFLDDPTNNLTHAETVHIMDFLIAKNRSNPPTAIFMTCNNVLLHCYADRVLNMENGHFHKHELHYVQRKLDKAKYIAHMTNATPRT